MIRIACVDLLPSSSGGLFVTESIPMATLQLTGESHLCCVCVFVTAAPPVATSRDTSLWPSRNAKLTCFRLVAVVTVTRGELLPCW